MSDPHFPELPRQVVLAVRSGRKLEAIKLLREHTGMDLTDAKRIVDRIAEDDSAVPRRQPEAGHEDSGMLRLAAAVLVLGAIAAAFYLL